LSSIIDGDGGVNQGAVYYEVVVAADNPKAVCAVFYTVFDEYVAVSVSVIYPIVKV
jgi:hypothetical protein